MMRPFASALALLVLLVAVGCGLPEPSPNGDSGFTTPGDGDVIGGDSRLAQPSAPTINPLPSSYSFEYVPIRGTSDPSVQIIAQSSTGVVDNTASNGTFCLDFPLTLGQLQTITLRAQSNVDGQFSAPTQISITQDGSTDPAPPPPPAPENVASGAPVSANYLPNSGLLDLLTDGEASSLAGDVAYWERGTGDVVVIVDLGAIFQVSEIKLHFGLNYPEAYTILTATSDSVGFDTGSEDWTQIAYADASLGIGGDGGWDGFYFVTRQEARHVAFEFPNPFWGTLYLDVSEIEVWAIDPTATGGGGDPVVPSCANGIVP